MCGIVGIWERGGGGGPPSDVIDRMLATIVHRGPDGHGTWNGRDLALGHRRLSILDLTDAARQPMVTSDGHGVIAYNGEVYNFRELRQELEAEGATFTSSGDTQVVLEALHRWGPERAIERFNGMFAFAYFDVRDEALWLARDRLGIKPLHVAVRGERVLFASEIKSLLEHPAVEPEPNLHAIANFVVEGKHVGCDSPFAGIEDVRPGSWWRITRSHVEKRHWFDVLEHIDVERIRASKQLAAGEVVAGFDRAIRKSVSMHLVSDVPVATMCSGGVDSSLITALAREHVPDLTAYVADVEGETEALAAARVGRHLGVPVVRVGLDREAMLRLLPEVIWHRDTPSFHASDVPHVSVARRCRADGVKVLLTGEGADELYGGYGWHAHTLELWRQLRRRSRYHNRKWRRSRFERMRFAPIAQLPARKDHDLRLRLSAVMEPERQLRPMRIFDRLEGAGPAQERAFLAQGFDDLYVHLGNILRRHDRAGMAASLEMRVPFLENDLIDMGMGLARCWKYRRRQSKWTVKQAALAHLPKDIVHVRKKGFPIPGAVTRGSSGLLRGGAVARLFRWSTAVQDRLIPQLEVEPYLRDVVASVEIWARLFLEGETREDVSEKLLAAAGA